MGGAIGLGSVAGLAAAAPAVASPAVALPMADAVGSGAAYFLLLNGIAGDSIDARHPKWIDVQSLSWGASLPAVIGGSSGGSGTGKASISELNVTTPLGSAGPIVFRTLATGQHVTTATLEGVSLKENLRFLKVVLEDLLITSYATSAGVPGRPQDSLSIFFAKITYSFWPILPSGVLGPEVTTSFSVIDNT
jgi:type VI protein secretion system component Hcp